jgi:Flp pilus assembly protein TadG
MRIRERSTAVRSRRKGAGQSVVEFALILPILMTLLLVTVDVGRLFNTYVGVVNASREGAAYAITSATAAADATTIKTFARQEGATTYTVTSACTPSCTTGSTVTVTVTTTFSFLFPIGLPNVQLSNSATGVIPEVIP